MTTTVAFIESLLRLVPDLMPIYEEHLTDNDTLLPHVFMGDVTRFVISKANDPRGRNGVAELLAYLEAGLENGSEEIEELIVVSFVENLRGECSAVKILRPMMGAGMKRAVDEICGY